MIFTWKRLISQPPFFCNFYKKHFYKSILCLVLPNFARVFLWFHNFSFVCFLFFFPLPPHAAHNLLFTLRAPSNPNIPKHPRPDPNSNLVPIFIVHLSNCVYYRKKLERLRPGFCLHFLVPSDNRWPSCPVLVMTSYKRYLAKKRQTKKPDCVTERKIERKMIAEQNPQRS